MAWKYIDRTKDNEEIVAQYLDKCGFLTIVAKDGRGKYNVHQQYDPTNSSSYWGHYGFDTVAEAIEDIHHCNYGPYIPFQDINGHDLLKVKLAYFLFNHCDAKWLKTWNHCTSSIIIDVMNQTDWKDIAEKYYSDKTFEDSPIGFLRFIDAYNERNCYLISKEF